jgi:cyanophycin synthetase
VNFFDVLSIACKDLALHCTVHGAGQYATVSSNDGALIQVLPARFPINLAIGARAAGDKVTTKALLAESGHPVIRGVGVNLARDWQSAFDFFGCHGGRLIVKPANGERGNLVFLCDNSGQLAFALSQIALKHSVAVIEEYIDGDEYRVLILDSKPLYVLQRKRFFVYGDGSSTLFELLTRNAPTLVTKILDDPRMRPMAGAPSLKTILGKGVQFAPVPAMNVAASGIKSVDPSACTEIVNLAAAAASSVGLRYAGVDIIVNRTAGQAYIIEVNSAPELEGYDSLGEPSLAMSVFACRELLLACLPSK